MFSPADHLYMARALRLAERGLYTTRPNPRVGCVIARDDLVVAEGWHQRAGGPHAEAHALQQAGAAARGATVYVTLEPCSHHGRTPPCADALISAGVARVVCAMRDPNPQVSGRGIARLQAAGIAVECGLMESAASELNIGFVARMTRGRPWLRVKLATSLDGKSALSNGVSQWISGPQARLDVQHWRARSCAILTGIATVLADDPKMTVREFAVPQQPLRVVLDSHWRTPPDAQILADGGAAILGADGAGAASDALHAAGAPTTQIGATEQGGLDLTQVMTWLAAQEVNEVLVEAGARLNGALLAAGLVDEMVLYMAPKILGAGARGGFEFPDLTQLAQSHSLRIHDMRQVGADIRILARPI